MRERRPDVGGRFHGDYQGIENWTGERDVIEELAGLGIEPAFEHTAFRECVLFDARGRAYPMRSSEPLWYMVRRGPSAGTLDQDLKRQALAAGVTIEFGASVDRLPEGGIIAHGPHRPDVIAVGYVGESDLADGSYAVVGDSLAPKGYAYLEIHHGRVTLATCLFEDFHSETLYLDRTRRFFEAAVGLRLRGEKRFGGFGNVSTQTGVRRGDLLFVGEAAGLQDALFGFGMRYALFSGHLAGTAALGGGAETYERECARQLLPSVAAGVANRFLYHAAGAWGYRWLLRKASSSRDPRAWLRGLYRGGWWTRLVEARARTWLARRGDRSLASGCKEGCECTWCRCVGHGAEGGGAS